MFCSIVLFSYHLFAFGAIAVFPFLFFYGRDIYLCWSGVPLLKSEIWKRLIVVVIGLFLSIVAWMFLGGLLILLGIIPMPFNY